MLFGAAFATVSAPNRYVREFEICFVYKRGGYFDEFVHWLVPEDGELRVEIRGALAGILALSAQNSKTARVGTDGSMSVLEQQIKLVAGARNHRELTTLGTNC